MREKLALLIALGSFTAVVAVGSGLAVAQVNVPGTDVQVPLPCAVDLDPSDPDCDTVPPAPEPEPVPLPEPEPVPLPEPTLPGDSGSDDGSGGGGGSTGGGGGGGGSAGGGATGGLDQGGSINPDSPSGGVGTGDGNQTRIHTDNPGDRKPMKPPPPFKPDGSPTISNPSTTLGLFGPAPIGVPNFVIDSFEIPPFLLPIYQACGTQYGIPWQVLASINKIETAFGTNLNVSYAGAVGWMQFIPSTWQAYGVDANADGRKDPYNPVDAICAAARYLRAAGGSEDLYNAIFAYNHADWYVDEVLLYARSYGKLPDDLVSSLTGLTEGAHFPVAADARYADDIGTREALKRSKPGKREVTGNAAEVITSSPSRRGINIFSRAGAPIVAVNDGVIKQIGANDRLGNYIVLQDAYGNRFTYAKLGGVVDVHPVPKPRKLTAADFELVSPPEDSAPNGQASDEVVSNGDKGSDSAEEKIARSAAQPIGEDESDGRTAARSSSGGPVNTEDMRPRLYALPERPEVRDRASLGGQLDDLAGRRLPGYVTFKNYFNDVFGFNRKTTELRPLREGSKVIAGTVLGRMAGSKDGIAPYMHFMIRPSGRGAPAIDPKPILDGWKLLEATAIYRAAGKDPFANSVGVGAILLMSKEQLISRVLSDPRLEIYSCGRTDIRTGQINRRILALLEYLAEKGFRLTITSLTCGHGFLTASGNVSNHSSGNAVDIATINGIPVLGNQGPGTLTEALLKTVLGLQGTMVPDELISLMDFGGPSFPLADHADHVHVGYSPGYGDQVDQQFVQLLKPDQWERLIDRLGEIDNPDVPVGPSSFSLPTENAEGKGSKGKKGEERKRASDAHLGE